MSVYLDASVLVALVMVDAFTARADEFPRANAAVLIVSNLRRLSLHRQLHAAFEPWT